MTGLAYHPYWDVVAALGGYDAEELAAQAAGRGGVPGGRGQPAVTGYPRQSPAADATL